MHHLGRERLLVMEALVGMAGAVRHMVWARHGADEVLLHHWGVGSRCSHLGRLLEQGGGRHLGRSEDLAQMLAVVVVVVACLVGV